MGVGRRMENGTSPERLWPVAAFAAAVAFVAVYAGGASAQSVTPSTTALPPATERSAAVARPAGLAEHIATWLRGDTATGEWFGWRDQLEEAGVHPTLSYTTDILGNPLGGMNHKVRFFQDIFLGFDFDLEQLAGIGGASVKVTMSSRAGNSLSNQDIGNVFNVSQVCCQPHTRLVTFAWDQSLFADQLDIRLGRMSVGEDFATSPLYDPYITSGIDANPGALAINVLFTEYPDTSLGVRLRARPEPAVTLQFGLYDGDPDGTRTGLEDFNLSFNDGVLLLGEAGYHLTWNRDGVPLSGHYNIGGYYNTGRFRRLDAPEGSAAPGDIEHGNGGIYATVDQQLVHFDPLQPRRGIVPFVAVVGAPSVAISPFPFFFDAGVLVRGPLAERPNDDLAFGIVYGAFSNVLRDDQRANGLPLQDFEMVLEWTYVIQVTPWLQLLPDVQYVVRPGGTGDIPNALVLGGQIAVTL